MYVGGKQRWGGREVLRQGEKGKQRGREVEKCRGKAKRGNEYGEKQRDRKVESIEARGKRETERKEGREAGKERDIKLLKTGHNLVPLILSLRGGAIPFLLAQPGDEIHIRH